MWMNIIFIFCIYLIFRCLWACGHSYEPVLWPEPECGPFWRFHAPNGGIHDNPGHHGDETCQSDLWFCQGPSRISVIWWTVGSVFGLYSTSRWWVLIIFLKLISFNVLFIESDGDWRQNTKLFIVVLIRKEKIRGQAVLWIEMTTKDLGWDLVFSIWLLVTSWSNEKNISKWWTR